MNQLAPASRLVEAYRAVLLQKLAQYRRVCISASLLVADLSQLAQVLERDRKVAGSISGRSGGRMFLSRFNLLC